MIARIFLVLLAFRPTDASPHGGTLRRSQRRLDIFAPNGPMSSPSLGQSSRIDSTVGIDSPELTFGPSSSPTICPIENIYCDFSTLEPKVSLSNATQAQRLLDDCSVSVTAINTANNNLINVFNSSDIIGIPPRFDPDLGSPNGQCPGGGPGIGIGGVPNSTYPNCKPLGNLLIIQNDNKTIDEPNDSALGGCFVFNFTEPVALINFGLLDIEEHVNITITTSNSVQLPPFSNPTNIGDNGHWVANTTMAVAAYDDVMVMKVCLTGSGAVSFLHFDKCSSTPTSGPTADPSSGPTAMPTAGPTSSPSDSPSDEPSDSPSDQPSESPSELPSDSPSDSPSDQPSKSPSEKPSDSPSDQPSESPSEQPSDSPSDSPSEQPSKSPSENPSDSPSDVPSDSPSDSPSDEPSEGPTTSPTSRPTSSPTGSPSLPSTGTTVSPTTCPIAKTYVCDFETLLPGVALSNPNQTHRLLDDCAVTVKAINTIRNNPVNVFNSSKIRGNTRESDPDLGSPNEFCPGGGPGRGVGGVPNATFPNCEPLGNLLIIQNENRPVWNPNDSARGGCFVFNFTHPVALINFGLLDIERIVNITTTTSDNVSTSFTSPPNVGDNGHWKANETMSLDAFDDVKVLEFCFTSSAAISFLHYRDAGCPTASPAAVYTESPTTSPTVHPTTGIPTGSPSLSPTKSPTTTRPTFVPTAIPTSTPSDSPVLVTASPTKTPTTCPIANTICDFSTLLPGVALSNATQAQRLLDDCSMSVIAINTANNNPVNVFNSSNILGYTRESDPDLGSPNEFCPGGGPGRGVGGVPNATFPNCEPLGNLLIIQHENRPVWKPNDSAKGGCFVFRFTHPVALLNFGILDIDEGIIVTITIVKSDTSITTINGPSDIGDNGYWIANTTLSLAAYDDVEFVLICLPGSGAISFLHYESCPN